MPAASTPEPSLPRWSAVSGTAAYVGVNERTIRRAIADGRLRAHRIGKLIRIDRDDIAKYIILAEPTSVSR
jgi:excisionase family DNA binding protein